MLTHHLLVIVLVGFSAVALVTTIPAALATFWNRKRPQAQPGAALRPQPRQTAQARVLPARTQGQCKRRRSRVRSGGRRVQIQVGSETVEGSVIDISMDGVGLVCARRFTAGEEVLVRAPDQLMPWLKVTVAYIRLVGGGTIHMGGSFLTPLTCGQMFGLS